MAGAVSQGTWSGLYYLYMGIALVVGALVVSWCLYSLWRYRARPGDMRPADAPRAGYRVHGRGHVLGTYVMAGAMAAVLFGLAFSTLDAVKFIEHAPVDEPANHFEVTGFQFGWQFRYFGSYVNETTGATESFTFTTVNDMRVPVDEVVTANVTSRDVQHVFGIPDFRIQIYASPGAIYPIWFKATETGEVPLRCLRNCGIGHDDMIKAATIKVVSRAEYDAFIASKAPKQAGAAAPADTTAARSMLLEEGQLVLDTPTLTAGQPVELTVMNRADTARTFGAGPIDAPWATIEVAAGQEAALHFTAPTQGNATVWSMLANATQPEATQTFEVMPQ